MINLFHFKGVIHEYLDDGCRTFLYQGLCHSRLVSKLLQLLFEDLLSKRLIDYEANEPKIKIEYFE